MPTVNYQIITSRGDARENETTGEINFTSTSILLGSKDGVLRKYHFLRFINVNIPQGATINSSTLKFKSLYSNFKAGTPPDFNIYAEKSINGLIIASADYATSSEISNRPRTTQTVAWTNPDFAATFTEYTSPDIATVIQEIVNQPEWIRGNSINIILVVAAAVGDNYNRAFSYDSLSSQAPILFINYTERVSGGLAPITVPKQKDFIIKIYDHLGVYLATWGNDVVNTPQFIWKMNGGMGEMNINLKRSMKDFGESEDVAFGNIVKIYIQDGDQEKGYKIWEGVINRYEPITSNTGVDIINVIAISRLLEMEKRLIKSGTATEVTYASKDPSHILKSLISMPSAGGILLKGKINDTGTIASYTFQANTIREGFDICTKLSPQWWYWWLNANNEINFKVANFNEIDHSLFVGKEISSIRMTKSIENLCNRVYFMGGGSPNLYKTYERTSSQSEYGLREVLIKDERVTVDATVSLLTTSYLDNFDHPLSEIEIEVVDSNIDPINGYDIERFKPGDIVQILHPAMGKRYVLWDDAFWDVDYWDFDIKYALGQPHQILEINYQFNKCILKLSAKLEDFQKRIEEVNRNLEETAKQNLPATAT